MESNKRSGTISPEPTVVNSPFMETPTDILSSAGVLAQHIPGFQVRTMQQEMAEAILQALLDDESLICEAGTGTGKTFAYLVPVLMQGQKTLISTGTKHLQDQLYHRDLPTVHTAMNATSRLALLKGRANYLCLHRYHQAEDIIQSPRQRDELQVLETWVQQTESGDLSEALAEDSAIRPWVSSTADNCLGQECGYYEECHVLKARKKALESDIVVVNHHLLLSDMTLRDSGFGELLPNIDTIIFDESHQLPELASQFFGISFSSRQCLDLANDTRIAFQQEAWDVPGFVDICYELDTAVRKLRAGFRDSENKIDWASIRENSVHWQGLEELQDALQKLAEAIDAIKERGKQLESCFKRNLLLKERLTGFLSEGDDEVVQWLELRGRGLLLHQTPLNVAEVFQQRLQHYQCHAVYTSATLTVNQRFDHFSRQLGLEEIQGLQFPSPFDYQQQTLLYLPPDMPMPAESRYTQTVIERALPVLNASRGRAFLLFTSHRALQFAAQLLQQHKDYVCYCQGTAPKQELLEGFINTENALLLGTASFWEGVDVKGAALSCVIIDKLPFAMPDDPVLRAREHELKKQGKNLFIEYSLPKAIIQLKQGVGRLIRDPADFGVLMICDPRLLQKSYGRKFLNSLPAMTRTGDIEDVEAFYRKKA